MRVGSSVDCITIPMRLLIDRRISPSAKLLYGLIEHYEIVSGGVCYETNASLASTLCDCTAENITKLVRELRKAGYVEANYIVGYGREMHTCK